MNQLKLANKLQELRKKLKSYEEKDKERKQDVKLMWQAVYEGIQGMANAI